MDQRFRIRARPRCVAHAEDEPAPPLSLAWHSLRGWHEKLEACRSSLRLAWESSYPAWTALADEYHSLGVLLERTRPALEDAGLADAVHGLELMHKHLDRVLGDAGVECLAPVAQVYTLEMSDYLENVAQQCCAETKEPIVLEVIEPAVRFRGVLVRPGKAVIGIPGGEV